MDIIEIIDKKRLGKKISKNEINYIIDGFLSGDIQDYQMSALLMAITINGMEYDEILNLTDVMINSGHSLDTSKINGIVVDKHSTGGIGDKVTLVLCPILASLGIKIAKMSGRGLGYTGGTIDKLESIPHFNVNLTDESFIEQVNNINIAICSPNDNFDVADKKIYALRDVTGTVESIPLIASSIMSKKIASGADVIVIDIKVGNGALMKDLASAKELARILCAIGKEYHREVVCLLSSMNQPLGYAIGNALEVKESMDLLQGNGPSDLLEVVLSLAVLIISPIKKISVEEAKNLVLKQINNGQAFEKFKQLISTQNGDLEKFKIDARIVSINSNKEGYINHIDSSKLGMLCKKLGAGKMVQDDTIDYNVGMVLSKKLGDYVHQNDELVKLYINKENINIQDVLDCFIIEKDLIKVEPLIYGVIK